MINISLARHLGVSGMKTNLILKWILGKTVTEQVESCSFPKCKQGQFKIDTGSIGNCLDSLPFRGIKKKLLPLPVFRGDVEEWPLFEPSFFKSNEAIQYSDLKNNMRLVQCLKGKAKEAIEGLLIHPHYVGEVLRKLQF
uniref:Uncharacterized protein n=1 Tax=Megaselia scalaris TaxID=36166 RepID=T1GFA8_MEGSC